MQHSSRGDVAVFNTLRSARAGVSDRKIFEEMKILTWNINGIRAAGRGRSMKDILDSLEADVICLQETKVTRE